MTLKHSDQSELQSQGLPFSGESELRRLGNIHPEWEEDFVSYSGERNEIDSIISIVLVLIEAELRQYFSIRLLDISFASIPHSSGTSPTRHSPRQSKALTGPNGSSNYYPSMRIYSSIQVVGSSPFLLSLTMQLFANPYPPTISLSIHWNCLPD